MRHDRWKRQRALAFELKLRLAECEFLTGALADAEKRLAKLAPRAVDAVEGAAVAGLQIDVYTTLDLGDDAIAIDLEHLKRHLGIDWSLRATDEVQNEYRLIWLQLGKRSVEGLVDSPLMTDSAQRATLDVLMRLVGAAWHTHANLACMAICRAVRLSLDAGNCDSSCYHYSSLGYIAGPRFGDCPAGYRFGRLGCELLEKRGLNRFRARVYKDFGAHVVPWTKHVRTSRDILLKALDVANQTGDLTFAADSYVSLNSNALAAGDPLSDVQNQAEIALAFARKLRFQFAIDLAGAQLGLVRTLRKLTRKLGSFDDSEFDEMEAERRFEANPNLILAATSYWVRKLQACVFAGDSVAAVHASR